MLATSLNEFFETLIAHHGFHELEKSLSRYYYELAEFEENGVLPSHTPLVPPEFIGDFLAYVQAVHKAEFDSAIRDNKNFRKRSRRYYDKVRYLLENNDTVVFVTLTFSDEALKRTSEETRRRQVGYALKDCCNDYIGNIDFGKKNGREHYHALVTAEFNPKLWKYGNVQFEYVKSLGIWSHIKQKNGLSDAEALEYNLNANARALAKYTAKLGNHGIKDTTRRKRAIYSRTLVG